ncbi:hypothetical protein [Cellvibrio sp. UBA7671]|uniref:hypothetical protein n=1 Tax=Cellvibrio sp. UBA7671 TaxID=1946312 RepID=UPI002F355B62
MTDNNMHFMVAGEPFTFICNFKTDATTALPLNGFTARSELRNQREGGAVLLSVEDDSPFFTRDLDGGQLRLEIPPSITIGLDFQKAVLDVWITDGVRGARSDTIEIIFKRGVTRNDNG